MSSRVLAVGVNSQYVHCNLPIRYFKAVSNCDIFECSVNDNIFDVYLKLVDKKYEIFAFSVYIWNRDFCVNLINMLKGAMPSAIIIAGGPEAAFEPESFFALCPLADGICAGEGENTFIALENGASLKDAPNMIFKDYKTEYIPTDLNKVIFPYTKEDTNSSKILYFETSRGCIFNCSYCLSSAEGKTRYFPMEYVKKGIDFFCDNNVPLVKLVDRTFNDNNSRCCEILEYIIQKSRITHFHFEISPMLISDEFLKLCQRAGSLIQLEMGIQTVNFETMKAINRTFDLKRVKEAVLKIPPAVHTHLDIIAGLPFDTKDTIKNAFNYVYSLKPDMLQLGFLKLLKGTKMKASQKNYNMITTSFTPYEVLGNSTLSAHEMRDIKLTEKATDRIYNSGAFKRTVKKAEKEDMYSFFEYIGKRLYEAEYEKPLSRGDLYIFMLKVLGDSYKECLALDFLENNNKLHLPDIFCDEIADIKTLHKKIKAKEEYKNKKIRIYSIQNKIYVVYEGGFALSD